MGTADEKASTRSAKEKSESKLVSGGTGAIGSQSESTRNQQERDNRAHSSESGIFGTGTAVTGGMLDHLIDESCDQVKIKKEDMQRLEGEIKRLESRIDELKALKEELQKHTEENI